MEVQVRYNDDYSIVKIELELQGDAFLDLVGSREDMIIFSALYKKVCEKEQGKDLGVDEVIRRLRLFPNSSIIFPYNIIRALDITLVKNKARFNLQNKGSVNLNPKIMIYFFNKTDLPLEQLKVIY